MRALWIAVIIALLASVAVDLVLGTAIPGFYAAFGFVGCIAIIVVSKFLGRGLQRDEDYYGEADGE